MKTRLLIFPLMLLALSSIAAAAAVTREMPSEAAPFDTVTVQFHITKLTPGERFTLQDSRGPLEVKDWSVKGAVEEKEHITVVDEPGKWFGWSFTAEATTAEITYTLELPEDITTYGFSALWFDRTGQHTDSAELAVNQKTTAETTPAKQPQWKDDAKPEEKGSRAWLWLLITAALIVAVFFAVKKKIG